MNMRIWDAYIGYAYIIKDDWTFEYDIIYLYRIITNLESSPKPSKFFSAFQRIS